MSVVQRPNPSAERAPPGSGRAADAVALPGVEAVPSLEVALPWLIRLRWVAVSGQALTVLVATALLQLELPIRPLLGVVAVTALSNLALHLRLRLDPTPSPRLIPAILSLDTLLLTGLLFWSGGLRNPFAVLYVVHVALAAVALRAVWAWWMVVLSAACCLVLYRLHLPLRFESEAVERAFSEAGLGAAGLAAAVLLVAAVIAFFTSGVAQALRNREKELRETQALVARNEWLASLAALAAGTAHELGTPLGTIAVVSKELERAAERLQLEQGAGASLIEDARLIRSQVDRCRRILDRLGALDREGHAPSPEPLDLDRFLAELLEEQPPDRRARLDLRRAPELEQGAGAAGEVPLDALHAVLPLVSNAFDAAGDEARVALEIAPLPASRDHGEGWRFVVRDQGPGMEPEVRARALDPFFTTKAHGRGMGLGLYLANLIAERHGGRLDVDSRPGEGTTATLELPRSRVRRHDSAGGRYGTA